MSRAGRAVWPPRPDSIRRPSPGGTGFLWRLTDQDLASPAERDEVVDRVDAVETFELGGTRAPETRIAVHLVLQDPDVVAHGRRPRRRRRTEQHHARHIPARRATCGAPLSLATSARAPSTSAKNSPRFVPPATLDTPLRPARDAPAHIAVPAAPRQHDTGTSRPAPRTTRDSVPPATTSPVRRRRPGPPRTYPPSREAPLRPTRRCPRDLRPSRRRERTIAIRAPRCRRAHPARASTRCA